MNDQPGHTDRGTHYGREAAQIYPHIIRYSDRRRFLYQFIEENLLHLDGMNVIDVGAGTGPWSIFAAQHGADEVIALDYQESMVRAAEKNIAELGLSDKVRAIVGDAANLKFDTDTFDLGLSVQVGCNLPNSGVDANGGFTPHIAEMARVLRTGGKAVITAPNSFGTVFTGGGQARSEIMTDIEGALRRININGVLASNVIEEQISKLSHVFLATFVERQGRLILVTDENELTPGERIWRKLENIVVPNYYHPITQYESEFKKTHLKVVDKMNKGFESDEERKAFNESLPPEMQLGNEYVGTPPFTVWILEKS